MRDPYRLAGLDRNPFVAEVTSGVDTLNWIDRGLPDALQYRPCHVVQVLGPKGAGKTSHLLRWRGMLPGPYRHVGPGTGRWGSLPLGPVVYWDEADRAKWFRVALAGQERRGGMVVVGTHRDLSDVVRRAGCTVESHELGRLSRAEVAAFAAARVGTAGGDPARFDCFDLEAIAEGAGASLREAGRLLHIEMARAVGAGSISSG